jgi:hypothetical protein
MFLKAGLIGVKLCVVGQGVYRLDKLCSLLFIALYVPGCLFLRIITKAFFA